MLNTPLVAHMTDPTHTKGAEDLIGEGCYPLATAPFFQAFETIHQTDAHFVLYSLPGTGLDSFPRLNKPFLSKLRKLPGCDVVCNILALDFDNPSHMPWSAMPAGAWGKFLENLYELTDSWPLAGQWSLCYATKKGARLVYILDQPIPADRFEAKQRWISQEFCARGIPCDLTVWDWTRCFRFPYVRRGEEATWEEDYCDVLINKNAVLAVKDLQDAGVVTSLAVYDNIIPIDIERPTPEQVELLIRFPNTETGRLIWTEFYKEAKKRLKGRDCFPCIFEHAKIAPQGARSSTIIKYVGQVIGLLHAMPGCTPEGIYALFYNAIEQLDPAPDTPCWFTFLWKMVCRNYSREEAKIVVEEEQIKLSVQEVTASLETIAEGMKQWCKHPALYDSNTDKMLKWVSEHLIVSTGKNFMIMGRDGYYNPMSVTQGQLIARMRITGIASIVETKVMSAAGPKSVAAQDIINDHATIVQNIRAIPEIDGAYIEDIDLPSAQLVIPCYNRNSALIPEYNELVDTWLHKLFGVHYDECAKWISHALSWDEGPICALSIAGKQGVGKKMLVQGLCECLRLPKMATSEDLVGTYQYGLFQSPFLVVNEGWPMHSAGMHPADRFRQLVSGDKIPICKKFQDPVEMRSPVRIIFTANNLEVVKLLASNKDLSPDDREALSIRLLHINLSEEASDWLRMKGGMAMTKGWIQGDGGAPSDFTIAKHFLHMWRQRDPAAVGARFLVEGNHAQSIMFEMRTGSGNAPLVLETIIRLIESTVRYQGITIEDGELYVLQDQVLTYYREEVALSVKRTLSANSIDSVLKGLIKKEHQSIILHSREDAGRKRWKQLDAVLLLEVAERNGMTCKKLGALVEEQKLRCEGGVIDKPVTLNNTQTSGKVIDFAAALVRKAANAL